MLRNESERGSDRTKNAHGPFAGLAAAAPASVRFGDGDGMSELCFVTYHRRRFGIATINFPFHLNTAKKKLF